VFLKPITIQAAGTSKSNKSKPNQTKPINGSMKQDTQPETRNRTRNIELNAIRLKNRFQGANQTMKNK